MTYQIYLFYTILLAGGGNPAQHLQVGLNNADVQPVQVGLNNHDNNTTPPAQVLYETKSISWSTLVQQMHTIMQSIGTVFKSIKMVFTSMYMVLTNFVIMLFYLSLFPFCLFHKL